MEPQGTARSDSVARSDGGPALDLDSPEQIAEMVRLFYADVAQDDLLGPMFNEVAAVDWSEHLPKLTAFWCRALLGEPGYQGNPFRAHALVNERQRFTAAHFRRWLELFFDTVRARWSGPNVERAFALVANVARVHSQQLIHEAVVVEPPPASGLSIEPARPRSDSAWCGVRQGWLGDENS